MYKMAILKKMLKEKLQHYLCLAQHLPYNNIFFFLLIERDLPLNSPSVTDLYLKSKFLIAPPCSKRNLKNILPSIENRPSDFLSFLFVFDEKNTFGLT